MTSIAIVICTTALLAAGVLGSVLIVVYRALGASRRRLEQTVAEKEELLLELTELKAISRGAQEQKELSESMHREFERLSQLMLSRSAKELKSENEQSLRQLLDPLASQLGEFRRRIDTVYDTESKDRRALEQQIISLKELNLQISKEAESLTNALKSDNRSQGSWGELVLERILESSGLRKGSEYLLQSSYTLDSGAILRPDVIINLPEQKAVIIDSKVSLTAYERYCSAEDPATRSRALESHLKSIKSHIKGLGEKHYEAIPQIRSLEFVLLFIPLESAFIEAVKADPELFSQAYAKQIIVVCPTTLLVTLKTISSIWRYEHQNRNARAIAIRAGRLYDKCVAFTDAMQEIDTNLQRAQRAYETALLRMSTGKGNIISQAEKLKQMGAAAKKSIKDDLLDHRESEGD